MARLIFWRRDDFTRDVKNLAGVLTILRTQFSRPRDRVTPLWL